MSPPPSLQDPQTKYVQPQPPQAVRGRETEMQRKPDHGETSYRGSGKLAGRRALVTGGDSGIGRAVAIVFAREGADVLISYLNEDEDAKETARHAQEEAHCQQLVEQAVAELGGFDILVNNAAGLSDVAQLAPGAGGVHGRVGPHVQDQHLPAVLAPQGRRAAPQARPHGGEYNLGECLQGFAQAHRLFGHEGRHSELHSQPGPAPGPGRASG